MSPRIIHTKGRPADAFLVDADNVIFTKSLDKKGVEWNVPIFRQAIQIRDLFPGQVVISKGHTFPRPVQITGPACEWALEHFPPGYRKIDDHAAKVLLSMPLCGEMKLTHKSRNGCKLGKVANPKGFKDWKFLTAWCWSKWEDERLLNSKAWSLKARWFAMQNQLGYPYTEEAFRGMTSDMELFVTESRKKR